MPASLSSKSRAQLAAVSISTLTTCLFKRGLRNAYMHGIVPAGPGLPRMVGEAFTLRFIPAREDLDGVASYTGGPNLHQRAFEECPAGHVLVIDTHHETRACSCGDLLVARLKARKVAGIVTDGGFRDSTDVAALGFPAYHSQPAPPPSFIGLHAVDLNQPIGCAWVAVYPGDVVVGDSEGVVVVPRHLAPEIAAEAFEMTRYDEFAAQKIKRGRSVLGLYPATDASRTEFARWNGKRRR
ncbi:MAG TPA: ribonuclease activity regulator RraA [Alphaproteobacteria bacterium]